MTRILLGLIVLLPLLSCKKDNDPDPGLLGKWNVETLVEKEYDNSVLVNTVTEPGAGITYDFRNNGQLVIAEPGQADISLPYTLLPGNMVDVASQQLHIQNLTQNSVTLFASQPLGPGPGDYEEAYINLRR